MVRCQNQPKNHKRYFVSENAYFERRIFAIFRTGNLCSFIEVLFITQIIILLKNVSWNAILNICLGTLAKIEEFNSFRNFIGDKDEVNEKDNIFLR